MPAGFSPYPLLQLPTKRTAGIGATSCGPAMASRFTPGPSIVLKPPSEGAPSHRARLLPNDTENLEFDLRLLHRRGDMSRHPISCSLPGIVTEVCVALCGRHLAMA